MEPAKYREAFERAYGFVEAYRGVDAEAYLSVEINHDCTSRICFFPSEPHKEEAVRVALKHFGKLIKDKNGNLRGEGCGVTLDLFSVLKCEIVGYKTERKPKLVESGDFVETQVPVYECRSPIVKEVVELANAN